MFTWNSDETQSQTLIQRFTVQDGDDIQKILRSWTLPTGDAEKWSLIIVLCGETADCS